MNLQGDKIYGWVETVARRANKFIIVSPFFSINSQMKSLLKSIPTLQILIADEFSINNPDPLKQLSEIYSTDIRCIYKADFGKRLHAKVFYAAETSGRCQALVGSANFTENGLTRNEEQAVSFDSDCETDRPILDQIEHWIDELQESATHIDWDRAKREYENSPNPSFAIDAFDAYLRDRAQNYWVLKTTEGSHGKSRWREFVQERVISVGWNDIVRIMSDEEGLEPHEYSRETLNAAAYRWAEDPYHSGDPKHAAKIIYWFSKKFSIGDRIIVCRGYAPNQQADVHLYGLAIVNGKTLNDLNRDWWRLKRSAVF